MEMLSPFGLMAFNGDEPVAAAFVYLVQGCDIAQISWSVTNPKAFVRLRYDGLESALKGLIALAKESGRTNIVTFSHSRGLTKLYSRQGLKTLQPHTLMYSKLGVM
jgi:hypothetical protein